MIAYRIQVIGKVQGVFFRATTKEIADNIGLKGWVRNEPDGSVLIHAEGPKEKLDEFRRWCENGPQLARVDKVLLEEIRLENHMDFRITH